jgi:hypothetical protein
MGMGWSRETSSKLGTTLVFEDQPEKIDASHLSGTSITTHLGAKSDLNETTVAERGGWASPRNLPVEKV